MAKRAADDSGQKIQMTPLIDVTFLILIFLMVLPFKTLERKVSAFLPKGFGVDPRPISIDPPPRLRVALRQDALGATRISMLDTSLGTGETAFAALETGISQIVGMGRDEVLGEIDAAGEVPHQDVVRTLDSFLRAGVDDITFIGTKPPPRDR